MSVWDHALRVHGACQKLNSCKIQPLIKNWTCCAMLLSFRILFWSFSVCYHLRSLSSWNSNVAPPFQCRYCVLAHPISRLIETCSLYLLNSHMLWTAAHIPLGRAWAWAEDAASRMRSEARAMFTPPPGWTDSLRSKSAFGSVKMREVIRSNTIKTRCPVYCRRPGHDSDTDINKMLEESCMVLYAQILTDLHCGDWQGFGPFQTRSTLLL